MQISGVLHGSVPPGGAQDHQPQDHDGGHEEAASRFQVQLRGRAAAHPHRQRRRHPRERQGMLVCWLFYWVSQLDLSFLWGSICSDGRFGSTLISANPPSDSACLIGLIHVCLCACSCAHETAEMLHGVPELPDSQTRQQTGVKGTYWLKWLSRWANLRNITNHSLPNPTIRPDEPPCNVISGFVSQFSFIHRLNATLWKRFPEDTTSSCQERESRPWRAILGKIVWTCCWSKSTCEVF